MNNLAYNLRDYVVKCCECHYYYVEEHMTLREVSREVCISKDSVKRRLESLAEFDREMYDSYVAEKRGRKNAK